jgi:SAM-dependent methyltransferase
VSGGWLRRTYDREVLGRLLDAGMRGVDPVRATLLAPVRGRVAELGFGSGANLPHYPASVTELVAVEPSDGLAALARARLAEGPLRHQVVVGSASRALPLDAGSFDAVVITFVLCSARHVPALLAETRRLLAPGAPLYIAEHVRAAQPALAMTQRVIRPAWRAVLGGCDPARDSRAALEAAGFDTRDVHDAPLALPFPVGTGIVGVARAR